jgi:hypothetical protein
LFPSLAKHVFDSLIFQLCAFHLVYGEFNFWLEVVERVYLFPFETEDGMEHPEFQKSPVRAVKLTGYAIVGGPPLVAG